MKCDLSDATARSIIADLKDGYGIEDIAARGTATQEQARHVLNFMAKHGLLEKFYRNARKKWKKDADAHHRR